MIGFVQQGLDPLVDPSACAQYRQPCFRQSSARVGHDMAKATVMRLLAYNNGCNSIFSSGSQSSQSQFMRTFLPKSWHIISAGHTRVQGALIGPGGGA